MKEKRLMKTGPTLVKEGSGIKEGLRFSSGQCSCICRGSANGEETWMLPFHPHPLYINFWCRSFCTPNVFLLNQFEPSHISFSVPLHRAPSTPVFRSILPGDHDQDVKLVLKEIALCWLIKITKTRSNLLPRAVPLWAFIWVRSLGLGLLTVGFGPGP